MKYYYSFDHQLSSTTSRLLDILDIQDNKYHCKPLRRVYINICDIESCDVESWNDFASSDVIWIFSSEKIDSDFALRNSDLTHPIGFKSFILSTYQEMQDFTEHKSSANGCIKLQIDVIGLYLVQLETVLWGPGQMKWKPVPFFVLENFISFFSYSCNPPYSTPSINPIMFIKSMTFCPRLHLCMCIHILDCLTIFILSS